MRLLLFRQVEVWGVWWPQGVRYVTFQTGCGLGSMVATGSEIATFQIG